MKNFKNFLGAAACSTVVAMSMVAPVFAEETTPVKIEGASNSLTVTKTVETRPSVPAPLVTFDFDVVPVTSTTSNSDVVVAASTATGGQPILAGVTGGLSGASTAFTPNDNPDSAKQPVTAGNTVYSKTAVLTINKEAFASKAPGIYRYQVTEKRSGEGFVTYEGMEYSSASYFVDVYYYSQNEIIATIAEADGSQVAANKSAGLVFNNDFSDTTGDNGTREVAVTKKVTGNQGDTNKYFTFKVNIPEASNTGERFRIVKGDEVSQNFGAGSEQTVTLKHGETFKIVGLSKSDKFTVNEETYTADGYTTTYKVADTETAADHENIAVGSNDVAITVENNKNTTTPTGILMTYGPYALIVALGAAFAGKFMKTRREED